MTVLQYGETAGREVSKRIASPVANLAALKAIPASSCADGQLFSDLATGKLYQFSLSCALSGDDQLVVAPVSGSGMFLLLEGVTTLVLPFTKTTADAAALYTVPTGAEIAILSALWNVGTSFTGGTGSAIGVSSDLTGFSTKGDILGGAAGDVAATLVSTGAKYKAGTVGAGFDTNAKRDACILTAAKIVRFDRITDAFTAGAGNVVLRVHVLANPGA